MSIVRGTVWAVILLATGACSAQTPFLENIETPYPAIQGQVTVAGYTYGSGRVAYGPVGTPLVLTGSNFGDSGTVNFVGYKNGAPDGVNVSLNQSQVSMWTSNMIFVQVPSGAVSGVVTVTSGGVTSNDGLPNQGLPFLVTNGSYSGNESAYSCQAFPPTTQLQITTSSLHDGMAGQSYNATLSAEGGTGSLTWSLPSGTLPNGLSLNASNGAITGTPTTAGGPVDLTLQVADSSVPPKTNDAVLPLNILSATLTPATVYSYSVPGTMNTSCSTTGAGFDGVGNICQYQDSVMGTWTFGYDTLNRLTKAVPGANAPGAYMGTNLCFAHDPYGNRTAESQQSTACPAQETSVTPTASFNANNQVTWTTVNSAVNGFIYDAAGNVQYDNLNYYFYDGEGRVCAIQTYPYSGGSAAYGYIYDAEGRRVAKGTVTPSASPLTQPISCNPNTNGFQMTESYILGHDGQEMTTMTMQNGVLAWQRTNIHAGGQLIATVDSIPDPNNTSPTQIAALHFHLTDPLGTRRMQTSSVGQPETDCQSLPYGDQLNCFPGPVRRADRR